MFKAYELIHKGPLKSVTVTMNEEHRNLVIKACYEEDCRYMITSGYYYSGNCYFYLS